MKAKKCTCRYSWEFYYCLLVKRREIWYRKMIFVVNGMW